MSFLYVASPFESMEKKEYYVYQTLFRNHHEEERIDVIPWSILRMRIERAEVPWADIRFESKKKNHQ